MIVPQSKNRSGGHIPAKRKRRKSPYVAASVVTVRIYLACSGSSGADIRRYDRYIKLARHVRAFGVRMDWRK
jgi:hypothetical protein